MPTLKELREKQAKLLADARAKREEITDKTPEARQKEIEKEHDAMMAEWDRLDSEYEKQEAQEEREAKQAEREDRARQQEEKERRNRRPDPGDREERSAGDEAPSVNDVFTKLCQFGASALNVEERSVFQSEIMGRNLPPEIRAQSVGTPSEGGYMVPTGFLNEITKTMAIWGPMMDPDMCRLITTDSGNPLPWPTVNDTANTGAKFAENAASHTDGTDDVTFGQKQLDAYVYRSGVVQVPLELLQDSAFDMQSLLNELLGERLARSGNAALTTGDGTGDPNGIMTATAEGVEAAAVAAITLDEVLDLEHSVDMAYRMSPKCRFQFHDTTLKLLRKIKDSEGNYIWQGRDARTGAAPTLLGYNYRINNAIATPAADARSMVFGDHGKYIVRMVRGFNLIVMRERFAELLQVGFLGWNRLDGELADGAAIKHLKQASS
ncbi:phage major capsid protein [Hyphococcus flavus]|uniref:Phage major capsid protein n=1 Tax=Hyphococcus flavus TaxID=1866326 RepID=A0AAE9ZBE6_9PROT|nr:phage major capsid protein [Hyphococcus flavus]WDI31599.1 phage major capsid protein [Hyphococcus flavus]